MSHAASETSKPKHTNRLAHETSPYLLQHAHNPVDWYPWGDEAIERARAENKPIFLSVGYSTCYWCHVMERQSFENEAIAAEMNARFVNVKVDREERPDVDQLYMTAVQVLTRHGGWPMSVFLSPDLRPFYGGTYFPPEDGYGRPGFLTLVKAIDDAYRNRPQDVQKTGTQLESILQQLAEPKASDDPITIDRAFLDDLAWRSVSDYEPAHGGFGHAPKFPRETVLEFLLVYLRDPTAGDQSQLAQRKSQIWKMLLHTLDAMADGGIRDHLGGGFHRYSTDAQWLVPHFEIMLYDNAMLAWVYAEAFRQTRDETHAKVARGICDFVLREMTALQGAFYTAFDAEVDAQEGLSYLWTRPEVESLLTGFSKDDLQLFLTTYGLDRGPNFADPHHGTGRPDKNILFLPEPLANVAKRLNVTVDDLDARLAPMRETLYQARLKRKQPLLDTKIITSWNALMIRALAFAGRILNEPRYADAANKAADYLLKNHLTPEGGLWRTTRDGRPKYRAFLDDYAFFAQALLELDSAEGADRRHEQATQVADAMVSRFHDATRGGFFFTEVSAKDILVRQKVATDSPLPSGNGVAAQVMLDLDRPDLARGTLSVFAGQLDSQGESMSALAQAALSYVRQNDLITVPGADGSRGASPDRPLSPEQLAAAVVQLRAAWADPRELHFQLQIASNFHVNAHHASAGLIGTHLTPSPDIQELVESIEYPPGEERAFAFANEPVHVYDGLVTILVRFKQPMTGKDPIQFGVSYQACDDNACLPPITQRAEVATP